ncbi:MAG: M48 family metallopeptidase [Gemmatimonadaceae bacterium]|jgi:Zn-dependent protease with chaperone function|nr:M48 family metallopeptidase [Gemmatimonadaceae bacterium]
MASPAALRSLVHRKERLYFLLLLVTSMIVYALGIGMLVAGASMAPNVVGGMAAYIIGIPLVFFIIHGLGIGYLRGNGVRVTARQFPELLAMAQRHASTLGLARVPDLFVQQSGGVLNAFATRFLGRDFVVVYSDILAMAEQRGEAAVSFIVAHELAHVQRGHLKYHWLLLPGRIVPFLSAAYSRACEYTCDRFGAYCAPEGAVDGLLVLAAGKDLYHRVEERDFAGQVETDGGFWVRWAELLSTHPRLPKRVAALLAAGVRPSRDADMPTALRASAPRAFEGMAAPIAG